MTKLRFELKESTIQKLLTSKNTKDDLHKLIMERTAIRKKEINRFDRFIKRLTP